MSTYHLSAAIPPSSSLAMSSSPPQEAKPSSYVVLLSGTHVTGKESLAVALSQWLNCPWLKAEMCHASASFGARSQAKKGYAYGDVFGRIWLSKLRRLGFLSDGNESDGEAEAEAPMIRKPRALTRSSASREGATDGNCTALITLYATRKLARDAIREVMRAHSITPIFAIMQITPETLSGRTLGAEEPELAERIMGEKVADIEEPLEEEKDVILIDTNPNFQRDVDAFFVEIKEGISRQLAEM